MTVETKPPAFDLTYSIDDFLAGTQRDSTFLYEALEGTMVDLATEVPGGRVLDVACGTGQVAMRIAQRGCIAIGAEASMEMIGVGRYVQPESTAQMVRSLAEELPFADGSFDRVICQGSLDHFSAPYDFMREASRIIGPDGRVVIGLANFESVSCRLGRSADRLLRRLKRPRPTWRLYWQTPEDHNVRGDLPYVRTLGGDYLELDRCFGISMFWLTAKYGDLLDRLPARAAKRVWSALDRVARGRPQHSDMIISIWRKPGARPWPAR
jgi:2-polyprenyl-3-methyl-5-hydroxy-6-metoxy-1,4-benzoquinol methylase